MLEPPLENDAIMYLINAIYFKGIWSKPFDKERTKPVSFHTEEGSTETVSMMKRSGTMEYAQEDDYKAVRLPYGEGRTAMYCILPDEGVLINDFIESITAEKWRNIQRNLKETGDVQLGIPRFNITYGIKNLNESLKILGMQEAFGDQADFTGIGEKIYIKKVLHKAVIEVNEKGSEAAAATVVHMTKGEPMEQTTFVADRPFLFFIVDDVTGTLLFMGKIVSIDAPL